MPKFEAKVKQFPGKGGWIYAPVPSELIDLSKKSSAWGMVPITATIKTTTWDTSLLPMGNGTFFIALKAVIRKKEAIEPGNKLTISFDYR